MSMSFSDISQCSTAIGLSYGMLARINCSIFMVLRQQVFCNQQSGQFWTLVNRWLDLVILSLVRQPRRVKDHTLVVLLHMELEYNALPKMGQPDGPVKWLGRNYYETIYTDGRITILPYTPCGDRAPSDRLLFRRSRYNDLIEAIKIIFESYIAGAGARKIITSLNSGGYSYEVVASSIFPLYIMLLVMVTYTLVGLHISSLIWQVLPCKRIHQPQ